MKSTASEKEQRKCPECGHYNITEQIWGYPSSELIENKTRKNIEFRGCIVDNHSKRWKCSDCLHEWGDIQHE